MLTIYKASAGSGKTYTLAYEYVKLLIGVKTESGRYLLNDPKYLDGHKYQSRHRHILAITFTNKATEEMKSRIIDELSLLAADHSDGSKDCDYVESLIKEFGCSREELRKVSERALRELLFDYHHFNVSTIDSFFQTVLRAFAREIDRQGDYGIELSDDYAVKAGIGLMLDDLNYGNPPHRKQIMNWIRNYTVGLIEQGKDGSMFNRNSSLIKGLGDYVGKMGSEIFKQKADKVLEYLDDPHNISTFITEISNRIDSLYNTINARTANLKTQFASLGYSNEAIHSCVRNILNAMSAHEKFDIKKLFDAPKTIQKLLDWHSSGEKPFYVKKYLNGTFPPDSFTDQLRDLICDCRLTYAEIHSLEIIKKACPNLEFLGFALHYINRFRQENNLILLSDTHDLLERIIGGSDTPFIYEKIGVVLRHFLIDEFQDTSHMQWHNLKPLVANSLATDCDNLIIGDEKQAIYRFRNSDSSLLHHVVANEDFPDSHTIRGNVPAENTNHRSAPGIIKFNNALFTRLAGICKVSGYENTIQGIPQRNSHLDSYINIFDTSSLEAVNDMPAEFDITAREILRQHDAGYKWSDIAILVRYTDEAEKMVNYLLKNYPQINVLSDEALYLRNSPAVKLIVSMLKLIDKSYSAANDNKDGADSGKPVYASAGDIRMMISRYEYFTASGFEGDEALRLALQPTDDFNGQSIAETIFDIRAAHPSGLVSIVETIIANKIPEQRRKKEYAYIAAFQDEVLKYCSTYNPSIHAFLDWWEDASQHLAISSGSGQDAVAVMTVHKSKGLQWQCVHIPFADWRLVRANDSLWISLDNLTFINDNVKPPLISVDIDKSCLESGSLLKDIAVANNHAQLVDNLNTTYVAYTRPKRELSICFASTKEVGHIVFDALVETASEENNNLSLNLGEYLCTESAPAPGCIFRYGHPTKPQKDNKEQTDAESSETVQDSATEQQTQELPDYKVFFREDTAALTTIDDAISDLGDIADDNESFSAAKKKSSSNQEKMYAAAERGTLLHNIMADISHPGDIEGAVSRAAVRNGLAAEEEAAYLSLIENAFDKAAPHTARWFATDCKILKEQSIYLPEGDRSFRPDRIIIFPDNTVEIVDYKFTGEPLAEHITQVEGYLRLIKAMGFDKADGYLWYPELNLVKQVTI